MSHILPAVACCCGETPCGQPCCDPGMVEYGIFWNGSFVNTFNPCACDLTVPNYICPCYGQVQIAGGQVGRAIVTQTQVSPMHPCGECDLVLEGVPVAGTGFYMCPCACQWEDPPGSGQFYTCQQVAPEFCGTFGIVNGVGNIEGTVCQSLIGAVYLEADTTPNQQFGGRWSVYVPIGIGVPAKVDCQSAAIEYCHPASTFGQPWHSTVYHPNGNGVRFIGPVVRFCNDGRLDMRSMLGQYSYDPDNIVFQGQNQTLTWNPGTVTIA